MIVSRAGGNCDDLLNQVYAEESRHALAISAEGIPIGYARSAENGEASRMVVMPGEDYVQVEFALQQILQSYADQESAYA